MAFILEKKIGDTVSKFDLNSVEEGIRMIDNEIEDCKKLIGKKNIISVSNNNWHSIVFGNTTEYTISWAIFVKEERVKVIECSAMIIKEG